MRCITIIFTAILYAAIASTSLVVSQEPRIGGQARLDAWQAHLSMAQNSPFKDLAWQTLGPKFAGGRIKSIAAPQGDLGTIYLGSVPAAVRLAETARNPPPQIHSSM